MLAQDFPFLLKLFCFSHATRPNAKADKIMGAFRCVSPHLLTVLLVVEVTISSVVVFLSRKIPPLW